MDSGSSKKIALISIHPEFVEKIINGTKKVEFRKRSSDVVGIYFVYATSPVQKIVGFFEVEQVHRDTPKSIWKKFLKVAGIDSKRYFDYYSDYQEAVAIEIKKFHKLKNELSIQEAFGLKYPPQSYAFLSEEVVPKLKKELSSSTKIVRELANTF